MYKRQVFGNNNQGLRHENTTLIIDKLKQEARKAGLYIKASVDPFERTVSLCPDEDGRATLDDSLLRKVMQSQPLTVNRLNLCIDQPAKLTKTVMDTVFRFRNMQPIQFLRIDPTLYCHKCRTTRLQHEIDEDAIKATHFVHVATGNLSLIHI